MLLQNGHILLIPGHVQGNSIFFEFLNFISKDNFFQVFPHFSRSSGNPELLPVCEISCRDLLIIKQLLVHIYVLALTSMAVHRNGMVTHVGCSVITDLFI